MKSKKIFTILFLFYLIVNTHFALTNIYNQTQDSVEADKIYYAVEVNGVLCGYFEAAEVPVEKDGMQYIQQDAKVFAMLSLLGSKFNQTIKMKALLEPGTRRCAHLLTDIDQGTIKYNFEMEVVKNIAKLKSTMRGDSRTIELNPDILIGSDQVFLRIKKDMIEGGKDEVSYNILETIEEEVQKSTFKKTGEEKIELIGKAFKTVTFEQTNTKTGIKVKYWMAPDYDYFIKFEVQNRKVYLADRTVVDKIKVSDMDASFVTQTNVSITDYQSISYMKLKVQIEPSGVSLKSGDLNVPGQKFSGTVINNVIDGTIEIEPKKYDGSNAPAFPPPFTQEPSLKKYLIPETFIESDDPALLNKAKEITAASKDSWEAAKRISKWVSENITYAIPGGVAAKKTFDIRAGECGAHSRLVVALCRAVGIPARMVFGAMYVPNYGGGFGQHAWNEIYMGNAGWIPVDATAFEHDYIDAGHIRITEVLSNASSFNGKKIEVLEHKLFGKSLASSAAGTKKHEPYFGKYSNLEEGRTFTVLEKEGNLAVDVPGQIVLPFNEEDENGRWLCKIVPSISIEFKKDKKGKPTRLVLYQIIVLSKKSSPEKIDDNTPVEFMPYLGNYFFVALNVDFTVFVDNGQLAVYDPMRKVNVKLQKPSPDGGWLDEYNKNTINFTKDNQGNITEMKINTANYFERGGLASDEVDKVIGKEGLEAGLEKYFALKEGNDPEIIFTEHSFNQLGYKYLTANKIAEAIGIFKLNAQEHPESFNVYDSLAEAYMKNGNNELAVENYKKSLELNPKNENAAKILEKLKAK
jgi:hypothetical protein